MAMGANMLIGALLSAIGLEPNAAKASLINLQDWIVTSIKSFDSRLRAAETVNAENARKLDLILSYLGVNENGTNEQLAGTDAIAGCEQYAIADDDGHGEGDGNHA